MLVFDLLSPISQTLWMWWSAHLATHFDLLECLDQVINSDGALSTSAAWVSVQWICIALMHLDRHKSPGVEFFFAALLPALAFVFLAIIGGVLMTRFKFTTRSPKNRFKNDFIKSGRWWGAIFVLIFSIVLVWYISVSQVSTWMSQLEYRATPFVLAHGFLERMRSYLRAGGFLLVGAGVLLAGLGQARFVVRYRGRVEYLVKKSRD